MGVVGWSLPVTVTNDHSLNICCTMYMCTVVCCLPGDFYVNVIHETERFSEFVET